MLGEHTVARIQVPLLTTAISTIHTLKVKTNNMTAALAAEKAKNAQLEAELAVRRLHAPLSKPKSDLPICFQRNSYNKSALDGAQ